MKGEEKNNLIYLLYLLVNFLITIGESTKKIVLAPFALFFLILKNLYRGIGPLLRAIGRKKIKPGLKLTNFIKKVIAGFFYLIGVLLIKFISVFINFFKLILQKIVILIKSFFESISLKIRYFFLGFIICLILVFINQSYFFVKSLPSPNEIGKINYPLSTHILDRNGNLLYEIYREQNRTPIKLKDLPPYIHQATIAVEDKEFYNHVGVSIAGGIFRAIRDMIFTRQLQGGSTITQQLVKSSLLTPERTINRKIKEIILALWTEQIYNKDQILEMYLNQVAYGGAAYGIEEAAKTYFGKSAKDLSLSEAALLAGLPQRPTYFSPYSNPIGALQRRNETLKAMLDSHFIDNKAYEQTIKEVITIKPLETNIKAPHFVFFVKNQLAQTYGIREVEEGGLMVETTLDLNIQSEAEKILREELDQIKNLNVTNGAILITRPQTGEILAMVGSYDYFAAPSGAFNVTTALRQPGSSIKPIMYSLALEKGYTAASIIDDSPVSFNIAGSKSYQPVNYDGRFHGKVPLRYALANSYNVPAVKVLNTLGVDNFVDQAKKMGITSWSDSSRFGLSLTLGGGEVSALDMAKAFGVLANLGSKVDLSYALNIIDSSGKKIFGISPLKTKVIDEGIAYIISDILSDNFARLQAFGPNSSLEVPGFKIAVKTGTTDEKKDNWTVGYTPDFLVVVWVGNNDNTPMNRQLASGITGAAPIWNRVMSYLLRNYGGKSWYQKPENVVSKKCYFGRTEYFISGTENKVSCSSYPAQSPTPSKSN